MNLLSLINPSLEIVYYSTTLSNRYIIRFIRFVSQFSPRDYEMYFISYPHLILLISDQTFEVTVAHEKLRRARTNEEGTKEKKKSGSTLLIMLLFRHCAYVLRLVITSI